MVPARFRRGFTALPGLQVGYLPPPLQGLAVR